LPHLYLGHDQRRFAHLIDADEGIGRELAGLVVGWLLRLGDARGPERETKGEDETAVKPILTSARRDGVNGRFSETLIVASYAAAARLIAARIRT